MTITLPSRILPAATLILLTMAACDKEKIVESTEYVHDIEYVNLPGDTVLHVDTVYLGDSSVVYANDTVFVFDTIFQTQPVFDTTYIHDTITTVQHHYDTTLIVDTIVQMRYENDTVLIVDTIVHVQHHYDTTVVVDTVQVAQCAPNEYLAISALQYYSDQLVIDAIYQEYGYTDGWILYLSNFQLDVARQSADTYDIYGLIDYWAPDWSGFCPFEFFWRMTHTGGDPADPNNWQMSEPPGYAPAHEPGLNRIDGPTVMDLQSR